jgi:hypothetical protein
VFKSKHYQLTLFWLTDTLVVICTRINNNHLYFLQEITDGNLMWENQKKFIIFDFMNICFKFFVPNVF